MEKKSELLTQSIMVDFGITEEEMAAIGGGNHAQWHARHFPSMMTSLPELIKPTQSNFKQLQQPISSVEAARPGAHTVLSSVPLTSTVIALPNPRGNIMDAAKGNRTEHPSSKSQGMMLCSSASGSHQRALQVDSSSPTETARKRAKVASHSNSAAQTPRDTPTESAVRALARPAQSGQDEGAGKGSPLSGTSVNAGADSGPTKAAARARSSKSAKVIKDRSSQYRGVTKHRRSGRWEAHLWVKELGRQVYLGGYEKEEHAAEAYDVAALKCKGPRVRTNFPLSRYSDLTECMGSISVEELIMAVRRQSQGFSRGTSAFRGVTHHPSGRWEARIGVPGSKHIYLGLFTGEREAAKAYDRALVRLRGTAAATNFALSDYRADLADYHKMQQRVLQADGAASVNMLENSTEFERWIKVGIEDAKEKSTESSS
ncbi:probable AP2-like ethylene-responsive transcription factor PLT2 at C-terminar half [Coccomyxa sp. Obi]|nr:probable AP2-like ethylene-responsive transcription factor PLT2 at C-terminar half [Coccomyxa sp. Obi]